MLIYLHFSLTINDCQTDKKTKQNKNHEQENGSCFVEAISIFQTDVKPKGYIQGVNYM